ncbi:hypothetical protein GCM10011608_06250 [Micromonospora sonchi]|uniref:Uncharacterized protein n=1 Tax=Micromonospora sonchi TaxID=1763543 RepID=A0A917TI77_9ACTN|nr:hypothetical protein GCM10011608_06250 [Micromonospora sonchi]
MPIRVARAASWSPACLGGSAPLLSPSGGLVFDDPRSVPPAVREIAAASIAQLDVCRAHAADWVYLSPPAEKLYSLKGVMSQRHNHVSVT